MISKRGINNYALILIEFVLKVMFNLFLHVHVGFVQAFEKAWKAACSSNGAIVLVVPQKTYLVRPIEFSGPCKSHLTMQVIEINVFN